ncbi:hypothetical protein ACVW0K_007237 [Streptomyces filamentosus]
MRDNDFPAPTATGRPPVSRLARLRAWWKTAWTPDGVLRNRWEDLRQAPTAGWHQMANWIKAVIAVTGASVAFLLTGTALGLLADLLHQLWATAPTFRAAGAVWDVVDTPVRAYLTTHSAGLPLSPDAVYLLWQTTGLYAVVLGCITRSNGLRLTWLAWGAAGIAMVWTTTPATTRPVATGIAVLLWTVFSAFALRGLNLRPRVFADIHVPVEIHPQIHTPAPHTTTDDTPPPAPLRFPRNP